MLQASSNTAGSAIVTPKSYCFWSISAHRLHFISVALLISPINLYIF